MEEKRKRHKNERKNTWVLKKEKLKKKVMNIKRRA